MARKIVIIGAGASGLMAAVTAVRLGAEVTVLEQNDRPGKKLLATGNGRCNFSNRVQKKECYRSSTPDLVQKVLRQYTEQDTEVFFTELGISIKDRNGWLYPASDQAQSVLDVLLLELQNQKGRIKTRERVVSILPLSPGFLVKTEGWQYPADAVILCCGSPASKIAGSGKDAEKFADALHLDFLPFSPALCPLVCKGLKFSAWSGVRISGAVTLKIDHRRILREEGELQLTDYGVSGIPVFQISRYAVKGAEEGRFCELELDFLPSLTEEEIRKEYLGRTARCPYKTPKQQLIGWFPDKLIPVLLDHGDDMESIIQRIKHFCLTIAGQRDFSRAQVSAGGIPLTEADSSLNCRSVPGLYFAGEALDVDGACGGYNLQWAWSSGAVAGRSAAKENIR